MSTSHDISIPTYSDDFIMFSIFKVFRIHRVKFVMFFTIINEICDLKAESKIECRRVVPSEYAEGMNLERVIKARRKRTRFRISV